ncbi:MAG: mechanosensitive ion channel family protein [Microcoleaceae cyanobacterium MO_207.B10]|nr:mechanosensitive ion channel family protein [Microcoleaceae cyanobacterium MO_207.B10]
MSTRKPQIFKPRSIWFVTPWFLGKVNRLIKFIILTFLSFILTISWTPIASGQIPFLNTESTNSPNNLVDFFNRPYNCGNFQCSRVWFNGVPIFEVASYPIDLQDPDNILPVDSRAKLIQNELKKFLELALTRSKNLQTKVIESPEIEDNKNIQPNTKEINKSILNDQTPVAENYAIEENNLDIHPNSPEIQVSVLNGETVIIFPQQFGAPQTTILTVTKADILYYNKTQKQLAQEWKNIITNTILQALKERTASGEERYNNLKRSIMFIGVATLLSLGVFWLQKLCENYYLAIKRQLKILESSVSIDPEFSKAEDLKAIASQLKLEVDKQQNAPATNSNISEKTNANIVLNSAKANQILLNIQQKLIWQIIPKISLKQQNILKQQLNIVIFFRRLLQWVQVFIWGWGIGFTLVIYYQTRAIGVVAIINTISILGIWVFVSLADKVIDYIIELLLHRWAKNAQLENPNSARYSSRVSTYSAALTSMTSIMFWILAIILTAEQFGIATQVLASAGVIALVVGYLSQNIVTDIIAGALIFLNDNYTVGDVVDIAGEAGFVEKMNLYMTLLRSGDGELIVIPHRSITTIKNLTKNWSRVNFTIQIAYDADIRKAMEVIQSVAETMQNEVEWQDSFIEPAAVLGVEEVFHSGILIRVWIKTPPLQQWTVGREFRLRVKEAFDREGIGIGIPQRSLSVQNFSDFTNGKQDGKDEPKYSSVN